MARLAEASRRSAQLHADDNASRDAYLWHLEGETGNLRECARIAGLAVGHAHRIVVAETARRQGEPEADLSD